MQSFLWSLLLASKRILLYFLHNVVLTICVDGNMSTFDSHALADNLENEISNLNEIYSTTIHVNPV